jgi:hypothetical protein
MRYNPHHPLIPSSCSRLAMEWGNSLSSDSAERRRLQNRAAQRKFRRKSYSLLLLIILILAFRKTKSGASYGKSPNRPDTYKLPLRTSTTDFSSSPVFSMAVARCRHRPAADHRECGSTSLSVNQQPSPTVYHFRIRLQRHSS